MSREKGGTRPKVSAVVSGARPLVQVSCVVVRVSQKKKNDARITPRKSENVHVRVNKKERRNFFSIINNRVKWRGQKR